MLLTRRDCINCICFDKKCIGMKQGNKLLCDWYDRNIRKTKTVSQNLGLKKYKIDK